MAARSLLAAALLTLLAPLDVHGETQAAPSTNDVAAERSPPQWRDDTLRDIAAADMWVRSVYPGWVDPKNPEFRSRWTRALAIARRQALLVQSAAGYRAVMRALGNAAADPHVDFGGAPVGKLVQWAGIGLERRGDRYFATSADAVGLPSDSPPLRDAVFLGCDGRDADATLRHHLDGWAVAWDMPGNRTLYASSLFVDQENPFVARPRQCRFRTASARPVLITLQWREARREAVSQALRPFRRARPVTETIALSYADDGAAWFTIGNFGLEAAHATLREQIRRERQSILSRPYIVFDLRSNQGGNSALADALIETVWGSGAVPADAPIAAKRWRASNDVVDASRALRSRLGQWADVPTEVISAIDTMIPRLEAATAAERPFYTEDASIAVPATRPSTRSAKRLVVPAYVLTDGGCISSCIVAVNAFRRAGAVQVGDPTERQTRYVEAWFQRALPSGLGEVTLPIAIVPWRDSELGGEPVDLAWTGRASDEEGLRHFIAADAARRQSSIYKGERR